MSQEIELNPNNALTVIVSTLLEQSLSGLQRSSVTAFPTTKKRQYRVNSVRITNRKFTQYDDGKLLVDAKCDGESNDYTPKIMFNGVVFSDPNDPKSVTLTGGIHIQPIKDLQSDVQVSCTCMDFRWTFAWYNSAEGSLLGEPPEPYTKQDNSKPRNPTKAPGLCKHLMKLSDILSAEGMIQ